MALDNPKTPVPSDSGDAPTRPTTRPHAVDHPTMPVLEFIMDRLDGLERRIDAVAHRPPIFTQIISLLKHKNAPVLMIGAIILVALVWGVGNLAIEGYGFTVSTATASSPAAP